MRRGRAGGIFGGAFLAALAGATLLASTAQGQTEPGPHSHILLPPTFGATALSTQIHAQAAYIASLGDFLESEAIARRHHALAAEQEMRNAVQWVTTYFECRALNRAYRLKENPPHLDKEELRHQQAKRRIVDDHYLAVQGDPTDDLNWLLEELSTMWLASRYLPREESLADSKIDLHLGPEDIHRIHLTDGAHAGGHASVFRADEAKPLQTRWPLALRSPEFDEVRKEFEGARDQAVKEIADPKGLSRESQTRLMGAVDALSTRFNEVYSTEKRTESPATYAVYAAGKRFLRTLAGGVFRLIEANDPRLADGSYRFKGDSTVDLIDHMFNQGLQFSPPEPGDEATYRKLFFGFRQVYTTLTSLQPEPAAKGP